MKKIYLSGVWLLLGMAAIAQTWTGTTNKNWNTSTNWSTGVVPVGTSNVIIPGALTNYPILGSNTTINSITMQAGSQLDVNGFTFTINGVAAPTYFTGATLNNSNAATDIEISLSTESSGFYTYFRSNTVNDAIIINITGSNNFYEGDVAPSNQYNGNATFNINGSLITYISYVSPSIFNGNLTVNRTVAGTTSLFSAGTTITGNFAYTNNAGGAVSMGTPATKTQIGGTVNITANYASSSTFVLQRLVNQTTGGIITVQNSTGFYLNLDTLKITTLSITGYKTGDFGYLFNNDITGNVTIADDASYASGWATYIRNNVITGNTVFTINGTNTFYDADIGGTGNKYIGNVTFNCAGSSNFLMAFGDSLHCTGNLIIIRTGAGFTQAFLSGATINGNFSYNNPTSGNTYLGGSKRTSIGGTINIGAVFTSPAFFEMHRLINQTNGGIINVQNSAGFNLRNDTLKITTLSINDYKTGAFGYLLNNDITGNVTIADDVSYAGGYVTYIRNNVITGNTVFTNNGTNVFYDADIGGSANKYLGNVTYNGAGSGQLYIAHLDSLFCSGNVIINRTAAGHTQAFNSGATINGNFSYSNLTAGHTYLGGSKRTGIGGTINIAAVLTSPALFEMHRLINQTNGGIINVQNSAGFNLRNDTLKITTLSITGYLTGAYGYLLNNDITGNVTIADDASYAGGYLTSIRNNVITGNTNFTNNGTNVFYDADIGGSANKYNGNVTFNGAGIGHLSIASLDSLFCSGNVTINRTGAGTTSAFSAGATINGNFSYNNLTSGNTTIGGSKRTGIVGTVNIIANYTSPSLFQLTRLINQTAGGNINVQNSQGFYLVSDTLKVSSLSITGYKQGQYAEFYFNDITGNVTIADDATYGSGYNTYIRNNVITGNTSYTCNGATDFNESWGSGFGSKYNGDVTFTRNAGNVNVGQADYIEVTKNLTFNSTNGISIGRIKFNGSTNGIIEQLGTQPINIPFLNMEKTGTGRITLNDPVTITNTASFAGGNIYSSTTNELIFLSGSTFTGGSDASFIDGPVSKIGLSSFTFPVGNGGKFAPISISAPGVATDAFRAQYFKANPNLAGYDTSLRDPSLHHTSGREYWKLDRTNGTSNVKVTLSWDATRSGGVNNLTELRVAHWNGSTWKDESNGGTTGNNANGTIQTLNAVTSFSPFTLASSTALNPLPITLLSFEGSKCINSVCLLWSTENEQDFSHFVVEKSKNGTDYNSLINVSALNMGQRNTYTISDNAPASGVNFYRLKIVNNNGSFSYSRIVKIDLSKPTLVSVQPNPAKDVIMLKGIEGYQLVRIVDMSGSIRIQKSIQNTLQEINISSLPVGMYFIQLLNGKEKESIKLMKQ